VKEFQHTLRDEHGIHARPAGKLVKLAKSFRSTITASVGAKNADVKKLINLMGLGAKKGDEITVLVEGEDEAEAVLKLSQLFSESL